MSVLSMRLLGPPAVDVDGAPIVVDTRKAIAPPLPKRDQPREEGSPSGGSRPAP